MSSTDWDQVATSERPGNTGRAVGRTRNFDAIRARVMEYSHGCSVGRCRSKDHVLLRQSGSIEIKIADGTQFRLLPGHSYQLGDGDPAHRSSASLGVKLFIVG
jgi:hypothetical protein